AFPPAAACLRAWMLSASALGNSGLDLGGLPAVASWRSQFILLPLAALGGLGLAVIIDLWDATKPGRALSRHTITLLAASAIGNVGLSFDQVTTPSPGLDVLTIAMVAGRLVPLAFLAWLANRGESMDVLVG